MRLRLASFYVDRSPAETLGRIILRRLFVDYGRPEVTVSVELLPAHEIISQVTT